jgi:hypothetical protein
MEMLHAVPILHGCSISVTGLSSEERARASRMIQTCGGTFAADLHSNCTHLLVGDGGSRGTPKIIYATKWGITMVRPTWLYDSLSQRICLEETSYLVGSTDESIDHTQNFPYSDLTVDEINRVTVPPYLEGTHIYLGDSSERLSLLKRLVLIAGGTRHADLYDPSLITHYIVHNQTLSPRDVEQLRQFSTMPLVLHDQWLFTCFYARERVSVEGFAINVEGVLQASQVSQNPTKEVKSKVKNTSWSLKLGTNEGFTTDLENRTSQNITKEKVVKNAVPFLKLDSTFLTSLPLPLTVDASTCIEGEEPIIPCLPLFSGRSFKLVSGEPIKLAQLTEIVERHGGVVRDGDADFTLSLSLLGMGTVNELWMETCIRLGRLVDPNESPFYRPIQSGNINTLSLAGVQASVSGYSGLERDFYSKLLLALGARHTENLTKRNTHLIVTAPSGPKFEFASSMGMLCVTSAWLLECAKTGRLVECEPFFVGKVSFFNQELDRKPAGMIATDNVYGSNRGTPLVNKENALPLSLSRVTGNTPLTPHGKRPPEDIALETPVCHMVKKRLKEAAAAVTPTGLSQAITSNTPSNTKNLLRGLVFAISPRLWHRREELHDLVASLGGVFVWSYDSSCTHYIHQGNVEEESFREFRVVRQAGKWIVSPHWLREIRSTGRKAAESLYPHTFVPGQEKREDSNPSMPLVFSPPTDAPPIDFDSVIAADRKPSKPTIGYTLSMRTEAKKKSHPPPAVEQRVFALSALTPDQRSSFPRILSSLNCKVLKSTAAGGWEMGTTHLITSTPAKSEKFLAACAAGAWVLRSEYVEACAQEGKLVDEERHEWQPGWSDDRILASAPRHWRLARQRSIRPYSDWIVLLVADQKRAPSLANILLAGGATVYFLTDEWSSITHVLCSSLQMKAKIPSERMTELDGKFHTIEIIAERLLSEIK